MNRRATFTVLGVPAPQGSKTAVMTGGRARVIEGSSATGRARHKAWRTAVAETAREAWGDQPPLDGPVRLHVHFQMPKPKSARKSKLWADRKPDLDKILRCTLDGLADAGCVTDDARVVELWSTKQLSMGWTGARVEIAELDA